MGLEKMFLALTKTAEIERCRNQRGFYIDCFVIMLMTVAGVVMILI